MCATSVVLDYFGDRWNTYPNGTWPRPVAPFAQPEPMAPTPWTRDSFDEFKEILKRLEALDAKLGEPDCEDPAKAAWMQDVEARLEALGGSS